MSQTNDEYSSVEELKQQLRAYEITVENVSRERDELAAENAGFKHALSAVLEHVDVTDKGQAGVVAMIANDALFNSETPDTDAAVAEFHAEGVEKAAMKMQESGAQTFGDCYIALVQYAEELRGGA